MDTRESLIEQLEAGRQAMRRVADRVRADQNIYPPWRIKEVLAHITGWDDALIATLAAHARGDAPAVPAGRGADLYNESTVSERESLDLDHVTREWEATRQQLVAQLRALPPEKVDEPLVLPWGESGTVAAMLQIFIEHELEHASEIRALLEI